MTYKEFQNTRTKITDQNQIAAFLVKVEREETEERYLNNPNLGAVYVYESDYHLFERDGQFDVDIANIESTFLTLEEAEAKLWSWAKGEINN